MDQQHRRHFLKLATAGAVLPFVGLNGCFSPEQRLSVGSHVWLGYEPMFLARQLGLLDESLVRLVELPSATDSLHALHSGRIDAAALTLDEVLTARADGLDLQTVLVFNTSIGADVLLTRPGIESLSDLQGKRIVVEQTAVGALMLKSIMERGGLDPNNITLIYETHDGHLRAWQEVEPDAIITFEPAASHIAALGGQLLFSSRAIPDLIVDVLAVRREVVSRSQQNLQALMAAHFKAVEHLKTLPQDATERMATRFEITPAEVMKAYEGIHLPGLLENCEMLGPPERRLMPVAEHLQTVMRAHGLLTQSTELDDLINFEPLEALREAQGWQLAWRSDCT